MYKEAAVLKDHICFFYTSTTSSLYTTNSIAL